MHDSCTHSPSLLDRILYWVHIVIEPCRFVSHTSDKFIMPCLVTDWIELGVSCPHCITTELGEYVIVHPDEDDFEEDDECL